MNRPATRGLHKLACKSNGDRQVERRVLGWDRVVHRGAVKDEKRTYPMIGLEIINLLPEEDDPKVLAEELDHVQVVEKARAVAREPVGRRARVS